MTINESFGEFINHCNAKNLKPVTIEGYQRNYNYFYSYLGNNISLSDVNKQLLNDYINYLKKNTTRNTVSINTTLRSIRTWLNYCSEQGYLPKISIPYLKENPQPKDIYSHEDLQKLLARPNINQCTFAEFRNYVIVNTFIATGIRRHSLTNIKIEDVDFQSGLIRLTTTKAGKFHYVAMGQKLAKVLREYLRFRGGSKDEYLFVTEQNGQMQDDNLTNAIYRYNKSRGVDITSIHAFRHCYAVNYMRSVGDIFKLSKQLQHSSIAITQQYLRALEGKEIALSNTFNLLDTI